MSREMTETEKALVELVHFATSYSGMSLQKVKNLITAKANGSNQTVLERIDLEGCEFVNRLKIFINQSED